MSEVSKGGIKINTYGRPKTGKTRFAATFPKPMMILGTEDGTASIRNVDGVDFIRVISSKIEAPDGAYVRLNELDQALEEAKGAKYKTLVLDTASMLQDLVLTDILGLEVLPAQKSWGLASKEENQQNALQTKTFLREILNFPGNVVIIAHERDFGEEAGTSDIRVPVVASSLSQSVCRYLNAEVDYICQTFIRDQTSPSVQKVANKEVTLQVKTGKADYCLRVGEHPVYTVGFRLTPGFFLPDVIVDPSYDKIKAIIDGKAKS